MFNRCSALYKNLQLIPKDDNMLKMVENCNQNFWDTEICKNYKNHWNTCIYNYRLEQVLCLVVSYNQMKKKSKNFSFLIWTCSYTSIQSSFFQRGKSSLNMALLNIRKDLQTLFTRVQRTFSLHFRVFIHNEQWSNNPWDNSYITR